jgi:hypothetical protein
VDKEQQKRSGNFAHGGETITFAPVVVMITQLFIRLVVSWSCSLAGPVKDLR